MTDPTGPELRARVIVVSDGVDSGSETITIEVLEVDTAPDLAPIGDLETPWGTAFSFTATVVIWRAVSRIF